MRHRIVDCAFVLATGLLLSGDLDAGSLEPPGPPAPTMKTLDQVESRIPISSLPFSITQPGSYYLTRELTGASGQAGITITASFVTLDLNGFALIGVPGSTHGITTFPAITEHLVIRNGVIRNWGARGIDATSSSTDVHIEDLRLDGNGNDGLSVGPRSIVRDTTSTSNGAAGIVAGIASTVTRCTAGLNTGAGFSLGANALVSSSAAQGNGGVGFAVSTASVVTDCTAKQNSSTGFSLTGAGNRIFHSTAWQNSVGITGSDLASIEECTVEGNADDGIRVANRALVRGNLARNNLGDGIDVFGTENRIEDNVSTFNGTGIRLTGTNNLVVKNQVSSNTGEWAIVGGNKIGTITSDPNTANPWGNFDL